MTQTTSTSSDGRPWIFAPLAVFILSSAATIAAVAYVMIATRVTMRERFRTETAELRSDIDVRLETYLATLRAGAALFSASQEISRDEFVRFAESLQLQERYPGIQGIGFTARLLPSEVEGWIEKMRAAGHLDFRIWPEHPREEYHTISFLQPLDRRNAVAIGYDMFTEPTRRAAMIRARDTGDAAASGKVVLVQEIDEYKQAGLLIYVPVYRTGPPPSTIAERRSELVGYVYAPFRAGDLLTGIFDRRPGRMVTFRIFDTHHPTRENVLFEGPGIPEGDPPITSYSTLYVAGRPWTIQFLPTEHFHLMGDWSVALLVGAAGALVTTALCLMSRAQVRARVLAESRARQIEASEQALRRSESRFRRLYDSNVVGMVFAHADGRVLDANDAACRIFGRTRDEMLAGLMNWRAATPPEFAQRDLQAIEECLQKGSCAPYEKEVINASGARVPVLLATAALMGIENEYVAVVVDVTERKRAEEAMRLAREAAETSNRLKDEFLATVSHELRTPLNAMLGWTQLLRASPPRDPAELQRALETIERNARAQTQLIEDLLDVSRIISGKMRIQVQPVDPAPIIDAAIASVEPAATAKGVRLVRDYDSCPVRVLADSQRLQQIAWNLIANAIKFTPRGGTVAVSLAPLDGHVQFSVSDTGMGIDPEFLPHVFERFTQADPSPTRRHGGLGLGLGIVRHLVEMHGGTVEADSAGRDRGATFRVRLPAVEEPQPPREIQQVVKPQLTPDTTPRPLDGARILVVDDDSDALDLLSQVLKGKGAAVATAGSVTQAMQRYAEFAPQLIISDLAMPEEDGYDLIRRVRQQSIHSDRPVPAIALTAYARQQDRERALRAGFQFHLPKPVHPDELVRVSATLLGRDGVT